MAKFKIKLKDGKWIEVEQNRRVFTIVDENITEKGQFAECDTVGFMAWDEEVQDLDNGESDAMQCFNISTHLKWNEVDMTLGEFKAPSIERLREALKHVTIGAWCPDNC